MRTDPQTLAGTGRIHGWSRVDSDAAMMQGWDIFPADHGPEAAEEVVEGKPYGHRPYEVMSLDDPPEGAPKLADDYAAWDLLVAGVKSGNPLCVRARDFLIVNSRAEYEAIFDGEREDMKGWLDGRYVRHRLDMTLSGIPVFMLTMKTDQGPEVEARLFGQWAEVANRAADSRWLKEGRLRLEIDAQVGPGLVATSLLIDGERPTPAALEKWFEASRRKRTEDG